MVKDFEFDAFLSHSSKDQAEARRIAEKLAAGNLRVWFDEWEVRPGDNILQKIEEGLEHSRVLVLCISANALASDWVQLESGTYRFRDPLNRERRLIPVRLDACEVKGTLAQLAHLDWNADDQDGVIAKLIEACQPLPPSPLAEHTRMGDAGFRMDRAFPQEKTSAIYLYGFSRDGLNAASCSRGKVISLWDVPRGQLTHSLEGHERDITAVAFSADRQQLLSASPDGIVRRWNAQRGVCSKTIEVKGGHVTAISWGAGSSLALFGFADGRVQLWDAEVGYCIRHLGIHGGPVTSIVWHGQRHAISASRDSRIFVWDVQYGRDVAVFTGHTSPIASLAWSADERRILSGGTDGSIRVWNAEETSCRLVLEGHTAAISSVALNGDASAGVSGSADMTVRVWDLTTGNCTHTFDGHRAEILSVQFSRDPSYVVSADREGRVRFWPLAATQMQTSLPHGAEQVQYMNAKVLLVGESGAGKTGLAKVLAGEKWEPSDSTVGAWATQWRLPISSTHRVEREIWLWDFGGQADQRLIHQLYMDETSLAVLVFDGQRGNVFEALGQWDRDLTRTASHNFAKLLVAARIDAGGIRVSREEVLEFKNERGYARFLETSAKYGTGCEELKQAIVEGIRWENIPWRSSPLLFKRLKEEIVSLKDEGRVLVRFNELRESLQLRLLGEFPVFSDAQLRAVVNLLAGPGIVRELKFGSWILLQPEYINAYAQAVLQTMQADDQERGCILEEKVLRGELRYQSSLERVDKHDERFILLAMHQTLVERGLCLREHSENGALLIFPSYYRRERPELIGHPRVLVSYRFHGFLDDIYATLVVRLHHTKAFKQDRLWRYAADFRTLTGRPLGFKLSRRAEGAGELEVYFDAQVSIEEKIIFSKYVHEHLLQKARDVVRLRHYTCTKCSTPVENREVAMRRLGRWIEDQASVGTGPFTFKRRKPAEPPTIVCVECERKVSLWDDVEKHFSSPESLHQVGELDVQSVTEIDNESETRAHVGDVISTVLLAGQSCSEVNADHGVNVEIEFHDRSGQPSGKKLLLVLRSGDRHLSKTRFGTDVFNIGNDVDAKQWLSHRNPVLLVVRQPDGTSEWMDVRRHLAPYVREIEFRGERFDVMSVLGWRSRLLEELDPRERAASGVPAPSA